MSITGFDTTSSQKITPPFFSLDSLTTRFPLNPKNKPLIELYFEAVLGKQNENMSMDYLDQWICDILTLAYGFKTSELQNHENLINNLSEGIGFSNAFILLSHCYQMAHHIQTLSKNDWEEKEKSQNAIRFFKGKLQSLIEESQKSEGTSKLQINAKFQKSQVSSAFLKNLEETSKNLEKIAIRADQKKRIVLSALTVLGSLSLLFAATNCLQYFSSNSGINNSTIQPSTNPKSLANDAQPLTHQTPTVDTSTLTFTTDAPPLDQEKPKIYPVSNDIIPNSPETSFTNSLNKIDSLIIQNFNNLNFSSWPIQAYKHLNKAKEYLNYVDLTLDSWIATSNEQLKKVNLIRRSYQTQAQQALVKPYSDLVSLCTKNIKYIVIGTAITVTYILVSPRIRFYKRADRKTVAASYDDLFKKKA
jgi:hypothetical protein